MGGGSGWVLDRIVFFPPVKIWVWPFKAEMKLPSFLASLDANRKKGDCMAGENVGAEEVGNRSLLDVA